MADGSCATCVRVRACVAMSMHHCVVPIIHCNCISPGIHKNYSPHNCPQLYRRPDCIFAVSPTTSVEQEQCPLEPVLNADADLLEKWCVVIYDGVPYPGLVTDCDDDSIEVKTMNRIGNNRFYWPVRDDVIWYKYATVVSLIPPPTPVTHRHVEIDKRYWTAICTKLGL